MSNKRSSFYVALANLLRDIFLPLRLNCLKLRDIALYIYTPCKYYDMLCILYFIYLWGQRKIKNNFFWYLMRNAAQTSRLGVYGSPGVQSLLVNISSLGIIYFLSGDQMTIYRWWVAKFLLGLPDFQLNKWRYYTSRS